ncbi:type II secretion system protein N [Duganella sp. S19_KUP01_CR8]|uniref:type II secretion system protein N n=1 Tax=Duganella sp. S19_KUP01_CR8 TaxID=3025502 RepID=UPI002FCD8C5B
MKRLPLFVTVLAVVLLSASLAYWGLQLFKPQQRAIAAPPQQVAAPLNIEAAKGLFGGQITVAAVSNYQLKGVIAARNGGSDSAAIIVVDGQPPLALGVGREVVPGVTVKEVHPKYVMLSEGGALKRLELATDAGAGAAGGQPPPSLLPGPGQQPLPQIAPPTPQAPPPQQPPQPQPPQRSSVSGTTIGPVPGFDRTQ